MSILHIRNKITYLSSTYQNGIISLLPNTLGTKRTYSVQFAKQRRIHLMRDTDRLRKIVRKLSGGIVKSPLGNVGPIPNQNIIEYIYEDVDQWSDKPAATCGMTGRSYTYGMLTMLINRFAQAILSHCGMKPREVVGLLLPNIPEFIIVCHGAMEAGLIVTSVNPLYTPDELKRQFENAGVKMIVTIPLLLEVATTIGATLTKYKTTVCIGGEDDIAKNVHGLESLLRAGHESDIPGKNPKELVLLPYSSGTTGLPKGVMLSHYNLVANLVQGEHAIYDVEIEDDVQLKVFSILPFFHIYGFNGILNYLLRRGQHLISLPKFMPEDFIKVLDTYKPDFLFAVPSLLLFLASHPAVNKEHLESVQWIQSGAAPLTDGLLHKFKTKFDKPNLVIKQGYGMTEAAPVIFNAGTNIPQSKLSSVGLSYPGTDCKIVSLTTGELLGPNETGELLIKGPQIMMGYLNNEKATAEIIDEEGWLHTGDIAYYDEDSYFFIVDRCKELIKVKGNQDLLRRIEDACDELRNDQAMIRKSITNLTKRARKCIEQNGGHFEQLL